MHQAFSTRQDDDNMSAVLREMNEEIGLTKRDISNLTMKYLCIRNAKKEIRLNYYFFADLKCSKDKITKCNEGKLKWVKFDELNNLKMPYTAQKAIWHYLSVGINDDNFYVGTVDDDKCTFNIVNKS